VLLLAIDTSTSAITVALHDDERVLAEAVALDARRHAEHLAPGIRSVLAEAGRDVADVTAVVAGVGPGPFTGLRVGLVTARTFAFVRGIPLYGVCSLDALAHQAWIERPDELGPSFVVATDARRKEVYWADYAADVDGVRRVGGPAVDKPSGMVDRVAGRPVVGRGPVLYPDLLGAGLAPLDASAGHLAAVAAGALGRGEDLLPAEPLYLRRPDAAPSAGRKPVL
jgi:tRNA threonylcarbamoyladenosine biosynthesis protein TsaB